MTLYLTCAGKSYLPDRLMLPPWDPPESNFDGSKLRFAHYRAKLGILLLSPVVRLVHQPVVVPRAANDKIGDSLWLSKIKRILSHCKIVDRVVAKEVGVSIVVREQSVPSRGHVH